MRKTILPVLVLFVALMAFSGIAVGQTLDTMIKSQIESQLHANPMLSKAPIGVESKNGNVTLSGKVANADVAKQIVGIAKSTPGVKSVKQNLEIQQR